MATYQVKFYKGDYIERQRAANADNAICYVEHHFNGSSDANANYSLVVVATNASETSKNWGKEYASESARAFGIRNNGVLVGGYRGRGNGNLRYTRMPSILLEPFFITNPVGASWAKNRQEELTRILVRSIQEFFPQGGLVAFSVGHKYKTSNPNDRGVRATSGEWEADLAEQVLQRARPLLEAAAPLPDAPDADDEPIPAADVSPWAKEAQKWVMEKGISDGTRPQEQVTREELWTMLHRASQQRG